MAEKVRREQLSEKNGMRRKIMTEKEEQEERFHFTGMQTSLREPGDGGIVPGVQGNPGNAPGKGGDL